VEIPFVKGSEPTEMTACLAARQSDEEKSFWRKIFGKKD
jgi:hypothetical protein